MEIGNRVKIVKISDPNSVSNPNELIGQSGKIVDIDRDYKYPFEVLFDNSDIVDVLWSEEELEVIE